MKKTYYSPKNKRYFNMKMIRRICKKFDLVHTLDEQNNIVWFEKNDN